MGLRRGFSFAQVLVGFGGDFASARGALQKAQLNQVGLVDIFDGADVFIEGSSQGRYTHRATIVVFYDGG